MAEFTIISEVHQTKATVKELYDFLIDFKNFKTILPEDKVEDFRFTEDTCSFNVKGITQLNIRRFENTPHSTVKFKSEGLAKVDFVLEVKLRGESDKAGQCGVELNADAAPFVKLLAEKPLGKLINTMALKLAELEVNKV